MPKIPGERILTKIGGGIDGEVFAHTKNGREGKTVIKDFEGDCDDERKDILQLYYNQIRQIYGTDIIPRQKFLEDKENPGNWLLVQERIDMEDHTDILACAPGGGELSDVVRERLRELLKELKISLQQLEELRDSYERPFLDLYGDGNLVVTKDNQVRYIDTGDIMVGISFEKDPVEDIYVLVTSKIALLELVVEGKVDLLHDDIYGSFFDFCVDLHDRDNEFPTDYKSKEPEVLRNFLKNLGPILKQSDDRLKAQKGK